MTMGRSEVHDDLFRSVREVCDGAVGERSIFRLLAEQGHELFGDEMFADLYSSRGRRSIAPRLMATVMVLQRFEGLSDSEAVDRLQFDLRYKWACGLAYDSPSFDLSLPRSRRHIDRGVSLFSCCVLGMIDQLSFDRREKTLGHSVVPAVTLSAHALHRPHACQCGTVVATGVDASAIGMVKQSGPGLSLPRRSCKRIDEMIRRDPASTSLVRGFDLGDKLRVAQRAASRIALRPGVVAVSRNIERITLTGASSCLLGNRSAAASSLLSLRMHKDIRSSLSILSIISAAIFPRDARADLPIAQIRGLNIMTEEFDYLNPLHGILPAETGTVANYAEMSEAGERFGQIARTLFTREGGMRAGHFIPSSLPVSATFDAYRIGQWLGAVALCVDRRHEELCTPQAIAQPLIDAHQRSGSRVEQPRHDGLVMRSVHRRGGAAVVDSKARQLKEEFITLAKRSLDVGMDSRFYREFHALMWRRNGAKGRYLDYYRGLAAAWLSREGQIPEATRFLSRSFTVPFADWRHDYTEWTATFLAARFKPEEANESRRNSLNPYDLHLYSLLRHRLSAPPPISHARIPISWAPGAEPVNFTECGENSLRMALIQILYRPSGKELGADLDVRILEALGAHDDIRQFFADEPYSAKQLAKMELRIDWARRMSNRPLVAYRNIDGASGSHYELAPDAEHAPGAMNMLALINTLFRSPFASWEQFAEAVNRARKDVWQLAPPTGPSDDWTSLLSSLTLKPATDSSSFGAAASASPGADDLMPMEHEQSAPASSPEFRGDTSELQASGFGMFAFDVNGTRFEWHFSREHFLSKSSRFQAKRFDTKSPQRIRGLSEYSKNRTTITLSKGTSRGRIVRRCACLMNGRFIDSHMGRPIGSRYTRKNCCLTSS